MKMGADEYMSTLKEGLIPDIQELIENEPWVLVHDGAPAHRAKKDQKMARRWQVYLSFVVATQQPD